MKDPRNSTTLPPPEVAYVDLGRAVFKEVFPEAGEFDAIRWDLRRSRSSLHQTSNPYLYFTRYGSISEPLPARFASVVKAYVVLSGSASSARGKAEAARPLWTAIEHRLRRADLFEWSLVTEADLLATEQLMLVHIGKTTTHSNCSQLQAMMRALAAAPGGPIVRPIRVNFVTPDPRPVQRYTIEGQEKQRSKMPSDEAIYAIGQLFAGVATQPSDRLLLCVPAIMFATGLRIGEALTLPERCITSERDGRTRRFGLRYNKEKSPGGQRQLAVHWMTHRQADLVRRAVLEARRLTKQARQRALVLEAHPETVPLPGVESHEVLDGAKVAELLGMTPPSLQNIRMDDLPRLGSGGRRPKGFRRYLSWKYRAADLMRYLLQKRRELWVLDRRDGKRQALSETLFILYHNFIGKKKGVNRLLVEPLRYQAISYALGSRRNNSERSLFGRYGLRSSAGEFFSLTTHQFRHWITTLAAENGAPDHVIERWQNRDHSGDLPAYKHLTPAQQLSNLKAALKEGRLKGQVADMYFSLADEVRDVFLEGQLQAVHVTPIGLCVHDFRVSPCPKFLNCVKDCEDYLLDPGNKAHVNNLVQLRVRTQQTLQQALQQRAKGEPDLSENWVADGEATLAGIDRILKAASADGAAVVRPFEGKGSRFEPIG